MSASTPAFRRLRAASGAMAVYVSIRALTCILPFLHLILPVSSDQDARYGLELAVLISVLTLLASLPYALVLGSFFSGGHESVRKRRSMLVVVAVGTLDLASALAIVSFTDGWSSQFRHYWFTALLVPCLVLGLRRSLVLVVICIGVTNLVIGLSGGHRFGWLDDLLYLQIGSAVSTVIVAGVIGYLGDLVFELQRNRRSAEIARDNLGTMLEITQYTAVLTSGLNDLMLRMARAIGERHRYEIVGIYLLESGGQEVRLAGWLGEVEALRRHELHGDNLVHQAISAMDARFIQDGKSWNAAIPIRDADSPMGVLLIGSAGPETDAGSMTGLGLALVGHIAVGIQVARLRQRLESAATQHESQRITRQIHDRISSSLYSLMMYLETYAEQARLEGSPVHRRLESLIPSFAQLLIETRHYMYHLLPALRGESGLDALVDSMVAEFERASGIPVRLSIGGSAAHVPMTATMGLYHILQYRLSDILLLSTATGVEICLTIEPENISLSISNDGVETSADQMDRIRELAGDLGGDLKILNADDWSTQMVVDLSIEGSGESLDQTGDN